MSVRSRILFINPWDKRIGPNRYLADMLAVDAALAQNSIVALAHDDAAAEEYRALGCVVEVWEHVALVHVTRSRENLARVWRTHTRGVQFARSRLRALRPDAVVTNSENVWFGAMAARSLRIPHLQVFHALTLEHHWGKRPYLIRGYLRCLQLWSTKFIGVSQTVYDMLARNGVAANRLALVRNGLNFDALRAASEKTSSRELENQLQRRAPILLTLGRISAMKGHDLLIEALPRVREKFPNVLCLFGGAVLSSEGVEDTNAFYARLQQRVGELNLQNNVLFLGEIDYAPALLKRADVYVQPSRTESFCRAVVEALALGTPVAAFRAGALSEVIGDGGLLAPPEDVNALADAILCLLENETVGAQTLTRGRTHIRTFDARTSARSMRDVIASVRMNGNDTA